MSGPQNSATVLHPVFAGVLASMASIPTDIRQAQLSDYTRRLKRMDWEFESAPRIQRNEGAKELKALQELQSELDPRAEVWNQHARFPYLITRGVKASANLADGTYVCEFLRTNKHCVDIANDFASKHGLPPGMKVTVEACQGQAT